MDFEDFEICKNIVRESCDKLKEDVEKLRAVDDLIGEHATQTKKNDLFSTIFALQNVESKILTEMQKKLDAERPA